MPHLESRKTKIVQRTIQSVSYANREFTSTGPDGNEACIVAVPVNNACCFNCLIEVPSGPNVLWSSFGAHMGKLDPGMKCCWPAWNSVTALVSKQVVTYNAAPKRCPSKDNVFVDGQPRHHQSKRLKPHRVQLNSLSQSSLFNHVKSRSGYFHQPSSWLGHAECRNILLPNGPSTFGLLPLF